MDFARLLTRLRAILLRPRDTWPEIAAEQATIGTLYTGWILWLAAITPLASLIGLGIFGLHVPFVGPLHVGLGMLAERALLHYGLTLLVVFLMAMIAAALAANFGGRDERVQALKVIAYAWTPMWVVGLVNLVPALALLNVLLSLAALGYGIWLLWLGVQTTQGVPNERAVSYTAVLIIIGVVLAIAIGVLSAALTGFNSLSRHAMNLDFVEHKSTTVTTGVPTMRDLATALEDATKQEQSAGTAMRGESASDGAQIPDVAALKPLAPGQLKAMLPANLPGLPRTAVNAERSGAARLQTSMAQANYSKGPRHIELSISDLAANGRTLVMLGMVQVEQETANGYHKVFRKDGRTIVEDWDESDHRGQYTVIVADRFIVKADGNGTDMQALKQAVDTINLAALEQFKNTPGQ